MFDPELCVFLATAPILFFFFLVTALVPLTCPLTPCSMLKPNVSKLITTLDRVAHKALTVNFFIKHDQLADILTKLLVSTKFCFLKESLNFCSNLSRLGGLLNLKPTNLINTLIK